jgi:O-antigen/teichoic acid export membrane protein
MYLMVAVAGTSIWVQIDPPGPGSLIMSELLPGVGLLVILHTAIQAFFALWDRILRGADRFQLANTLNVAYSLLLTTGVILGAYLGGDYVGSLWGAGISLFLVAGVVMVMGIRFWGIALPPLRSFLSMGSSVGARSYVVKVSEVLAETFGVLYLSYHHDLAGVAAIVACQRISTLLNKPASMVSALLGGKIAGQDSGEVEARKALQVARFTFIGGFLLGIPLLLFAQQFTLLTLGEEFKDAVMVMVLFLLSALFRGHASAAAGLLVGQGCQRPYVLLKVGVLVVTVIGVIVLGPQMGAIGVALVQCIMSFVMMVVIGKDLAVQAKSMKSVFVGDDTAVLARFLSLKNHWQYYKGR